MAATKPASSRTTSSVARGYEASSASRSSSASNRESSSSRTRSGLPANPFSARSSFIPAVGPQGPRWGLVEHGPEHAEVGDRADELLELDRLDHVGVDAQLVALDDVRFLLRG